VAPSRALLGGFGIGARVALLWQHSANAKCQQVPYSLYAWLTIVTDRFMVQVTQSSAVCVSVWVQIITYQQITFDADTRHGSSP